MEYVDVRNIKVVEFIVFKKHSEDLFKIVTS